MFVLLVCTIIMSIHIYAKLLNCLFYIINVTICVARDVRSAGENLDFLHGQSEDLEAPGLPAPPLPVGQIGCPTSSFRIVPLLDAIWELSHC